MPYNNTPIAPPKEYTGTVSLPLARVKKIIAADEDINSCSNNAAFVIAVATEMFVQYLVERCHDVVKSERKPRRNIQYKDVANAVARIDNLEFLADVAPRTQTYKSFKEGQTKRAAAQSKPPADAPTADGHGPQQQQLSFAPHPNGQPSIPGPASPAAVNGHRPTSHGHSRNHSLEQQNILHPAPSPHADAMQLDGAPAQQFGYAQPYPPAIAIAAPVTEVMLDPAGQPIYVQSYGSMPMPNGAPPAQHPPGSAYHTFPGAGHPPA